MKMVGMDFADMDTGMMADTEKVICIHTCDTHVCVPGRYSIPLSITNWVCDGSHKRT
jgi:hypothetical protein